jgi:hypothetical protein
MILWIVLSLLGLGLGLRLLYQRSKMSETTEEQSIGQLEDMKCMRLQQNNPDYFLDRERVSMCLPQPTESPLNLNPNNTPPIPPEAKPHAVNALQELLWHQRFEQAELIARGLIAQEQEDLLLLGALDVTLHGQNKFEKADELRG